MINTDRLELIFCSRNHLEALLRDEGEMAQMIDSKLAEGWLQFPEATPLALEKLESDPLTIRWGMMLIRHAEDNCIIGTCGFKGTPDEEGMVELGYAVAPAYQGRGIATEAARGMLDYAFSWPVVTMIDAHTLAEWNASTAVLQKCGFTKIAEKHDEGDGDTWQWRIERGG